MCDSLWAGPAATASGVALFAKNSDRPPHEAQELEWHPAIRRGGAVRTTYLEIDDVPETIGVLGSRPRWMWGMEHGINEAGVAAGNEAVYTTLDPRPFPPALVGMDLVRLVLERAADAAAGVEVLVDLLERHGQGGCGHEGRKPYWSSFLIADPGRAFVVETSGQAYAVDEVADRRAISNRTSIPHFDAAHGIRAPTTPRLVDPRLRASTALLSAGPVSASSLREHLRSHVGGDDGWTICMHVDEDDPIRGEVTAGGMVAELAPSGPRTAWVAIGRPCRSLFVPVVVGAPLGDVPAWERFVTVVDPEPLRALEAELAGDFDPAPGWNEVAWRRVDSVLPPGSDRP